MEADIRIPSALKNLSASEIFNINPEHRMLIISILKDMKTRKVDFSELSLENISNYFTYCVVKKLFELDNGRVKKNISRQYNISENTLNLLYENLSIDTIDREEYGFLEELIHNCDEKSLENAYNQSTYFIREHSARIIPVYYYPRMRTTYCFSDLLRNFLVIGVEKYLINRHNRDYEEISNFVTDRGWYDVARVNAKLFFERHETQYDSVVKNVKLLFHKFHLELFITNREYDFLKHYPEILEIYDRLKNSTRRDKEVAENHLCYVICQFVGNIVNGLYKSPLYQPSSTLEIHPDNHEFIKEWKDRWSDIISTGSEELGEEQIRR